MKTFWIRSALTAGVLCITASTAHAVPWTQTLTFGEGGYSTFNNGTTKNFIHIMDENDDCEDYGSGWEGACYETSSDWDNFRSTYDLVNASLSLHFRDTDNSDEELYYRIESNNSSGWGSWIGEFDFDVNGYFNLPGISVGLSLLDHDLLAYSIAGTGGNFRFLGSTLTVNGAVRNPTRVPEPATLGLLGLGLVGLGLARRRRKSA